MTQTSSSADAAMSTGAARDVLIDRRLGRPAMPWRSLTDPADVAAALVGLFHARGADNYDECVSQTAHALQCGSHALVAGASDALVAAAFLHDIGHLLLDEDESSRDDLHHERVGARFLSNWFDDAVTAPIALHVPAKRYLCATWFDYAGALSPASVRSLAMQGGPMTEDEVAAFEAAPGHTDAVALRRWDDLAKEPGAPTPGLDFFESLLARLLTR